MESSTRGREGVEPGLGNGVGPGVRFPNTHSWQLVMNLTRPGDGVGPGGANVVTDETGAADHTCIHYISQNFYTDIVHNCHFYFHIDNVYYTYTKIWKAGE